MLLHLIAKLCLSGRVDKNGPINVAAVINFTKPDTKQRYVKHYSFYLPKHVTEKVDWQPRTYIQKYKKLRIEKRQQRTENYVKSKIPEGKLSV
jgi:hypothetical protein